MRRPILRTKSCIGCVTAGHPAHARTSGVANAACSACVVAGAAGFGFGSNSPDFPNMIYMIQMSMLLAGIATQIALPACTPKPFRAFAGKRRCLLLTGDSKPLLTS